MNRKMILRMIGLMLLAEAALMSLPAITALIYGEACFWAILISMGIAGAAGL